jgi:hypothetical protein
MAIKQNTIPKHRKTRCFNWHNIIADRDNANSVRSAECASHVHEGGVTVYLWVRGGGEKLCRSIGTLCFLRVFNVACIRTQMPSLTSVFCDAAVFSLAPVLNCKEEKMNWPRIKSFCVGGCSMRGAHTCKIAAVRWIAFSSAGGKWRLPPEYEFKWPQISKWCRSIF